MYSDDFPEWQEPYSLLDISDDNENAQFLSTEEFQELSRVPVKRRRLGRTVSPIIVLDEVFFRLICHISVYDYLINTIIYV